MSGDKKIHFSNEHPHFAPHLNTVPKPERYNWFHPPKPQKYAPSDAVPSNQGGVRIDKQIFEDRSRLGLERQRSLSESDSTQSPVGSPTIGSPSSLTGKMHFPFQQELPPVMKSKNEKFFFKAMDFK